MQNGSFGLLLLTVAGLAQACGGNAAGSVKTVAPGQPGTASPALAEAASEVAPADAPVSDTSATGGMNEALPPAAPGGALAPPSAGNTQGAGGDQAVIAQARKMVDIEARLSIEVAEIRAATEAVRKLAAKSNAQLVSETVDASGQVARADVSLRVPAEAAGDFLLGLETLGAVRNRQVTAKDIGKEYYDATIRLSNLEAVLERYEQILAQAKNVEEILRIEGELSRIRGQIEQLKGELRWMRDRAARATVHVSLFTRAESAPEPVIVRPEAKFHPGLRGSYLHDFRGDDGDAGYFGAGLGIGFAGQAMFEIQGFRGVDSDTSGLDGLFLTLSARIYSEFLGNGQREFLNPYLGVRAGYARFLSADEVLLGGAVGLEILKLEAFTIDTEVRAYGLFGSDQGGHLGLEPTLGASVAF